jgi:hypothetical protein
MGEILRRLLHDPANQALAWGIALAYLVVFQLAVADLTIDGAARPLSLFVVGSWESLVFRLRAPFQFEAVAILEAPFLVWLISPMNLAIGLALGLLTGAQVALVRIARRCAVACGLSPATGVLAGLPGLLAGSACCAPLLLVLLGVQVTASLVTLMGLMIPAAFALLLAGLALTLRVAARRCAEAEAWA